MLRSRITLQTEKELHVNLLYSGQCAPNQGARPVGLVQSSEVAGSIFMSRTQFSALVPEVETHVI